MDDRNLLPVDSGLDVVDLAECEEFWKRKPRARDSSAETQAILRLCQVFLENPNGVLRELVALVLELCGADSAGVSLAQPDQTDEAFWLWVEVVGEYRHFKGSSLPRNPSACGTCLARGVPQHLRVREPFFDALGIDAKPLTDGLLLPWNAGPRQGTLWVLAHGRTEAFDRTDIELAKKLTDFAGLAWRLREAENDSESGPVSEDALAMSTWLGEMLFLQQHLLVEQLQSAADDRADAERKVFEQEQAHLAEMEQRLHAWEGDGQVH